MSTGERIRLLRKTLGLTQSKFAERINISTSYMAELEVSNKKNISRILRLISSEFNVDEHWLHTGEGTMYHEAAEANLAKATGIFRSLSPSFQESTLAVLNIISDLYKTSI
ncbi:MAG: helix-turn-helix domain-containing protein [Lachnospiraceae bacterium]|nr:helix-turn-helix domain-containing protein [Lachnospiraceae bacterium]